MRPRSQIVALIAVAALAAAVFALTRSGNPAAPALNEQGLPALGSTKGADTLLRVKQGGRTSLLACKGRSPLSGSNGAYSNTGMAARGCENLDKLAVTPAACPPADKTPAGTKLPQITITGTLHDKDYERTYTAGPCTAASDTFSKAKAVWTYPDAKAIRLLIPQLAEAPADKTPDIAPTRVMCTVTMPKDPLRECYVEVETAEDTAPMRVLLTGEQIARLRGASAKTVEAVLAHARMVAVKLPSPERLKAMLAESARERNKPYSSANPRTADPATATQDQPTVPVDVSKQVPGAVGKNGEPTTKTPVVTDVPAPAVHAPPPPPPPPLKRGERMAPGAKAATSPAPAK